MRPEWFSASLRGYISKRKRKRSIYFTGTVWKTKGDSWNKNWKRVPNQIHNDEQAKELKIITDKIPKTNEAVKNLEPKWLFRKI